MGQIIAIAAIVLTIAFVVIGMFRGSGHALTMTDEKPPSGQPILILFLILATAVGGLAAWYYRQFLFDSADRVFVHAGLILMMVAGCFVRVITENKEQGKNLLDVSRDQLIYPLLFSPIIFYTIWSNVQGGSASTTAPAALASVQITYFHFYCAFVNGYFWQSIVAAVKPKNG